jgi:hypothetical protein
LTRAIVFSDTLSAPLNARDALPSETPASFATSLIVLRPDAIAACSAPF